MWIIRARFLPVRLNSYKLEKGKAGLSPTKLVTSKVSRSRETKTVLCCRRIRRHDHQMQCDILGWVPELKKKLVGQLAKFE